MPLYWPLSIERPSWISITVKKKKKEVHKKIEKETLYIKMLEIF